MSILDIENISFKYGIDQLYTNASMRLFRDDHAVLVGPNGAGKSTLLKLLSKTFKPDDGKIIWTNNKKIGYLDQYAHIDPNLIVKTYMYDVFTDLFDKEVLMIELYDKVANTEDSVLIERYLEHASNIQEELIDQDFYALKSKISNVINGLGLNMDILEMPIKHLSGGMRAKIILAKLLLEEHDVLLLDEPTNFLDIMHIDFLIKFLNDYDKAFLVVSHDEAFLKAIAKVVFAIENKNINRYKGSYDYYLSERLVRFEQHQKNYDSQQRLIKETKDFINKNIVRASTTKRAQSRRKMLSKMTKVAPIRKAATYEFNFPVKSGTGIDVLKIKDLEIGYNEEPLVDKLNFTIRNLDKVVITGENGIGKSTFIKTILDQQPKIGGTYNWIDTAIISYLEQDSFYESNETAFQVVHYKYHDLTNTEVMGLLATYGITYDMANRPLNTLSGGEQTKIRLALLKYEYSNVLILDEPTNHLDQAAKDALRDALINYQGTLILVSHEKEFYEDICDYEISLY